MLFAVQYVIIMRIDTLIIITLIPSISFAASRDICEQTMSSKFHNFSKIFKIDFHYHIWNHHKEKMYSIKYLYA